MDPIHYDTIGDNIAEAYIYDSDFEDGLIRACAELNDVDVILTRSADAFKRSKVRAMTCAEYLEIFG